MADQKLNIELDANAEPLLDALATVDEHLVNITDGAETASQSLKNIETAGELVAESAEKVASGMDSANGKLDNLNATASDAAAHRANGGKTERPMDWASALDSIQQSISLLKERVNGKTPENK